MDYDAAIQSRNIAAECKAAASTLSVIINSNSLITSLSADNSVLSEFCKSSCWPQITNTWISCGAYDGIKRPRYSSSLDCVVSWIHILQSASTLREGETVILWLKQFISFLPHSHETVATATEKSYTVSLPLPMYFYEVRGVLDEECGTFTIMYIEYRRYKRTTPKERKSAPVLPHLPLQPYNLSLIEELAAGYSQIWLLEAGTRSGRGRNVSQSSRAMRRGEEMR